MRFIFVSALVITAGCAKVAPTSTDEHLAHLDAAISDATLPAAASDNAPSVVFDVQLRSDQEPSNASTSESKGHVQVKVFENGTMEFVLTINNKSDETFTRAHIHNAPAGSNGPIHWDFLEAGIPVASIGGQPSTLRGVARARAAAVLSDLLANPDQYYVNVHSTAFPGGAIRGQLR